MFKISGNTIELTRGDIASIKFSIKDYTFKQNDYIHFRLYEKGKLNSEPIIDKKVTVNEESQEYVLISLTSDETKIGEMVNKAITYWYEIEFNGEQTIIGYDDNGPKELILYPEGVDNND